MTDRKNWQPQEDIIIRKYVSQHGNGDNSKLKWTQVASKINIIHMGIQRSGKQCRQRWWNQLNPEIKKEIGWSMQQEQTLFAAHDKLGNRWAQIAIQIPGRTDNSVKNHFYSALRKGMRRINKYISGIKKKQTSIKPFKQDAMNKVLMVADGNFDSKLQVKQKAKQLAPIIKNQLIELSMIREDQQITEKRQLKEQLLSNFQEFTRNCKKRKGKKKDQKQYNSDNQFSPMDVQSSNKQSSILNRVKSDGNLCRKTAENQFRKLGQNNLCSKQRESRFKTQQKIEENFDLKNQIPLPQFKNYKLTSQKQQEPVSFLRRMNSNFSQVSQQNEKGIFPKATGFSNLRNENFMFGQPNGFSVFQNHQNAVNNQQRSKGNNEQKPSRFLDTVKIFRRLSSNNNNNSEGPGSALNQSGFYDLPFPVINGSNQAQSQVNFISVIDSTQFNQNRNPIPSMLQQSGRFGGLSGSFTFVNFLDRSNPDFNAFNNNNFQGFDTKQGK